MKKDNYPPYVATIEQLHKNIYNMDEKIKVLEKALKLAREYMFNVMCADDVPSIEWFIKCAKEMMKSE